MFPQNRDVAPIEDTTYTILHNFDTQQLHTFLQSGMVNMAGTCVGIFLSGIAISLGVSSILLLVSKGKALSRRDYLLCAYTVILLLLLIAYEAQVFVYFNTQTLFFFQPDSGAVNVVAKALFMSIVAIALLTDGLLALRCFLVQRALGHGPLKWGNIFWVFPACLCGLTVVTGTIAVVISSSFSAAMPLGVLVLTSNLTLNVYATLFITIRLLLHRRMVMACTRNKELTAQYIYIVGILLESAAINLPITAAAAIWFKSAKGLGITLPTIAASQVLAAILIIHQTALGRAFSQRKETEIRELVETREHSKSGDGGQLPSTYVVSEA